MKTHPLTRWYLPYPYNYVAGMRRVCWNESVEVYRDNGGNLWGVHGRAWPMFWRVKMAPHPTRVAVDERVDFYRIIG
jgi:hypothetical protein